MGFFNFFRKLVSADEDRKIKKLSRRINDLSKESSAIAAKQKKRPSSVDVSSWYSLTPISQDTIQVNVFSPLTLGEVQSMAGLLDKRRDAELAHKRHIRSVLTERFVYISSQIKLENAGRAEEVLYAMSPLVQELHEESYDARFAELQLQIEQLKALLIQKEIERREQEKRRLAEEKARKERQKAQQADRIRQQKIKKEQEKQEEASLYEKQLARIERERQQLCTNVTAKKKNSNAYLQYLSEHNVHCFYHFTDERNIPSIKKFRGLYSWYYCSQHNIEIPNAGGDSISRNLDCIHGLQDYVRLSFCDDHPMAWKKQKEGADLVLLRIKVDVAAFQDTLFSNMNAADSDQLHGGELKDLKRVNIKATQRNYVRREDPDFRAHQAECMVKTFVPIEYIENINNPDYI